MIIQGSLIVQNSTTIRFQLTAQPFAQFIFQGTRTPKFLDPPHFCLQNKEVCETEIFILKPFQRYHFQIKM
jgi:hypothetical protein